MSAESLVDMRVAVGPFAVWSIGAEEKHGDGDTYNKDTGNNKRNAPGDMGGLVLVSHERVVDGGHDKVGDAAARVAEPSRQRVGGSDDVLVEEAGRPYLAGDEATSEDTDEETKSHEARGIRNTTSTECRYRPKK